MMPKGWVCVPWVNALPKAISHIQMTITGIKAELLVIPEYYRVPFNPLGDSSLTLPLESCMIKYN